jgi:hypothetical protein
MALLKSDFVQQTHHKPDLSNQTKFDQNLIPDIDIC